MIPVAASARARKKNQTVFGLMGKCVVFGCPNRMGNFTRGVLSRAPKRFFRFPTAPDRVKVWLAALRETDKDTLEQHFICEDHFLPEDIFKNGISSDAIPIMPPYLDGQRRLISPWSGDSLQEEEQWSNGGWDNEEEEDEEEAPRAAPEPPEQNPDRGPEKPPEPNLKRDFCPENEATSWFIREGTPLSRLTRGFLELLMAAPDASVDIKEAASKLQTHTHRVNTVIDVLQGIGLVQTDSDNRVRWIGSSPIFSFLWRDTLKFLTMLQRLKMIEDEVDRLFKSCAQQLFELTEDEENSALAYVSCEDICRLRDFQQQTVIALRSPLETKLVIPPPEEDGIQMQLKSENGPILALTCNVGPLTSEASNSSRVFSALERRVRLYTLNEVESEKMHI
ncbi:transcription factor E2F3-like [Girardinichthys multiradiatus]|uniref:transcription factor E2F3-like n=1 Tax=Girardinichthys multiradiatus TaxID=208333 RepID=UPI001FAC5F8D|nr:transcription factor E2F3-like [Girardinichthys multiradiatus]